MIELVFFSVVSYQLLRNIVICHNKWLWIIGVQILGGIEVVIFRRVRSKVKRRLCYGEAFIKYLQD